VSGPRAFGESLRRHREARGIPLPAVAEQTKIGPAFLVALERGDCSKWPGGIYSRAWIRAYAAAVGLDPEEIGARFASCFSQTAFPGREPSPAPPAAPNGIRKVAPLRLTLQPDPQERSRQLQRRVAFLAADLALAVIVATLASVLAPLGFWQVMAGGLVLCHAVGLLGGGGSATGWVERRLRRHARPQDDQAGAIAEAA
jgi:hypothetical protein